MGIYDVQVIYLNTQVKQVFYQIQFHMRNLGRNIISEIVKVNDPTILI